jgi:hypothetical protein
MPSLSALLCAVLLASPAIALAQEQRGSIEGVVKDTSGGLLPQVTVEARSPALGPVATVLTDSNGAYRFASLPPGRYSLTAMRTSFLNTLQEGVLLELGQVLKIELVLTPMGVTEVVHVQAESPMIDVKQNAAAGTIRSEIVDRIPKGRDYAGLVTFLPGVDSETRNRGIQIDGASGADNRFFIDGVDQTDLYFGTSLTVNANLKALATDYVQEVQVKASGYGAEYRAAIGGVITAITKSGSNQWHGGLNTYFTSDKLQGAVRPTLQLNPSNQKQAQYVQAPADVFTNWEHATEFSGPILRDRLWFYSAFDPQVTTTRRTVTFKSTGQRATFESRPRDQVGNYTVTAQVTNGVRLKMAGSNERTRGGISLPNIQTDGTSTSNPALFPGATRLDALKDSLSGVLDWIPSPKTFVNLTVSHLFYGSHQVGTFSDVENHLFIGSNFQFADIPASLQNVNGYSDAPSSSHQVRDNFGRDNANVVITQYGNWHGQHTLKAGVQFERITNDVLSGSQAPTVELFWDASYFTLDGRSARGQYGYYEVTRFYTQGDVHASNTGLFVQDAWTPNQRLTLNLGLRAENENVPSYRPENTGVHFGFREKMAPRVGFSWDPRGDSRWKIYGDWGVYDDLMKLAMSRVMFGADHWVNYYYTLDTFSWPTISCDGATGCPGTFVDSFDNRAPANTAAHNLVDPNLRPTQTEEFAFGFDHELSRTMSIGTRVTHKRADRVIEAVCDISYTCGVNNPGFGTAVYPFGTSFPIQPIAKRVYDSVELRLRKRLADRWSLDASYLWSRLWGNWSGINSSDEAVSCLQPNSCTAFDLLYYSYDASGHPTYGRLATDRPHRFKALGTYDLPWGTQVGVNFLIESGRPVSTVARMHTDGINFFPYGRGNLGRTPTYSQTDLLIQQRIPLGSSKAQLSVGVNVINLFDQMAVTNYATTPYRDAFNISAQQFFAGFDPAAVAATTPSIRADPRYRLANNYQTPRSIMAQARVTF